MNKKLEQKIQALEAEVKRLELKLVARNTAFLSIVGKSLDGILIINHERTVVYANYAAMALFDKNIVDLLGEPLSMDIDPTHLDMQKKGGNELCLPQVDGSILTVEVSVLNVDWNDEPSYVLSFRNITEQKKTEKILAYMAEHDVITDLPNRIAFERERSLAIEHAKEFQVHMAVLYLDLDDFKMVNDTLGHQAGDLLLKQISSRLKTIIRKRDTLARLGGDEFAVILPNLRKPEYAGAVADNILEKMDEPFILDGKEIYSNLSIGISVYPLSGTTALDLIKHADMAMYSSKNNGKNQSRFYSNTLNEAGERSLQISNGLRNALQKNELAIVYQPIVDLATGACHGIEALLRWEHPKLGLLYPEDFLPEANKLNLMVPIGKWVTRKVFSEFKQFDTAPLLFVSVNITADELSETKTVEAILRGLKEFDVDIKKVIFELTETSFVKNPEQLIKKLDDLFDARIQLAIDDYGTGYSSLSYLKKLPVSILKIDQSFIQDMEKNASDHVILQSTIQLAHELGIKVIAEGVEKKEQLVFLKQHKCDYVQGYYFSKPLSLKDAIQFIKKSK